MKTQPIATKKTFVEVIQILYQSNSPYKLFIRRANWDNDMYAYDANKIITLQRDRESEPEPFVPCFSDITFDDWEVHQQQGMTIIEALEQAKNGKKVRRQSWTNYWYMDDGAIFDRYNDYPDIRADDILAADWVVAEE